MKLLTLSRRISSFVTFCLFKWKSKICQKFKISLSKFSCGFSWTFLFSTHFPSLPLIHTTLAKALPFLYFHDHSFTSSFFRFTNSVYEKYWTRFLQQIYIVSASTSKFFLRYKQSDFSYANGQYPLLEICKKCFLLRSSFA